VKKYFLILSFLAGLSGTAGGYAIVTNGVARDTLSIPFLSLDSIGNPVQLDGADSLYIAVFYPGGGLAYKDSLDANDPRIKSCAWQGLSQARSYVFSEKVSVLDGAAPRNGTYSYSLVVANNGASLATSSGGFFQLVNSCLESSLDSAAFARKAVDSLNRVLDSLGKIIDSLESQDDWVGNIRFNSSDSTLFLRRLALSGDNGDLGSFSVENSSGCDIRGDICGNLYGTIDIPANLALADTIANRVLEDSSSYQGHGGGSADSGSLAAWIWNTPQNNHTLAGTFGKFLDTEVSGIGSGSGIYSYHIVTFDGTLAQPIPAVSLALRNVDQSALIAVGRTDNAGRAAFNLDLDTFLIIPFAAGYIFGADSIIVEGPGVDTVFGYRFDPGHPGDPALCRVYGFLYDISGQPESGATVTARLPFGVARAGTVLISPFEIEAASDSAGYFCLDLIPSSGLQPDTTCYEITVTRYDGTIMRERVIVPDQSNWLLSW
jgi:hypothetical protein